jgi:hypothetical protein
MLTVTETVLVRKVFAIRILDTARFFQMYYFSEIPPNNYVSVVYDGKIRPVCMK